MSETTTPTGTPPAARDPRTTEALALLRTVFAEERATFSEARVELRHTAGQPARIDGHALVYNRWSEDLGGFRERILPGAATASIEAGADVRGLFNHDPNFILGRRSAETLELEDQPKGLRYLIDPPETPTIRDLVLSPMARNELNQSSFQFIVTEDEWHEPAKGGGLYERDLVAFDLIDVSPVTFPAYSQTDVGLRARIAAELGMRPGDVSRAIAGLLRPGAGTDDPAAVSIATDAAAVAATTRPISPADPAWNKRMKEILR